MRLAELEKIIPFYNLPVLVMSEYLNVQHHFLLEILLWYIFFNRSCEMNDGKSISFYSRYNKWNNCLVKTKPSIIWENYTILNLIVSDFWIPQCIVPFNIRILVLVNSPSLDLFLLHLAFLIFDELNDFKVCIFTALKNSGIMRFVKIKHFCLKKLKHIIIC